MRTKSIAQRETKRESRIFRGIALYREHGEDIEDKGNDFFLVPTSEPGRSCFVDLSNEVCECADFQERLSKLPAMVPCKHIIAATIYRAKRRNARAKKFLRVLLSSCEVCGTRESEEFVTVGDDHLTFFEGQELCSNCAQEHGVVG